MSSLEYGECEYLTGAGTFYKNGYHVSYVTNHRGNWSLTTIDPKTGVICEGEALIAGGGRLLSLENCRRLGDSKPQYEEFQFLYGEGDVTIPLLQFKPVLVKNG